MENTISRERAERLARHEQGRLQAAALRATRVYPGPVGELVARELRAYAEFGYRFMADGLLQRLTTEILRTPGALPTPESSLSPPAA